MASPLEDVGVLFATSSFLVAVPWGNAPLLAGVHRNFSHLTPTGGKSWVVLTPGLLLLQWLLLVLTWKNQFAFSLLSICPQLLPLQFWRLFQVREGPRASRQNGWGVEIKNLVSWFWPWNAVAVSGQ